MTFGRSTSASGGSSPSWRAARVLACTATATPIVRDEILARLGLPADTPQIVRGFARPNLALRAVEVTGARERERLVDAALAEALGGRGPGPWNGHRLRPHAQASGRGDGAPRRPRVAGAGLSRRPRRTDARARAGRLRRGPGRDRGRDQRLRHGHRPARRPRGDPPGTARLRRGVLPGGGPRRPRRRARHRAAHGERARPAAPPGAARAGQRRVHRRTPPWSSTSGGSSSS